MSDRVDDAIRARCFHPTGTFIEFSKAEVEQSIPERFEKIVRRFPDRPAVESRRHRLTYRDLNRAANRIAHAVVARHDDRHGSIAVLMDHRAGGEVGPVLAGKLLDYMIPSTFTLLDALPLTDTLKVDRKSLPEPKGLRPNIAVPYAAPSNSIERALADIWAEVLELDRVGVHDNFFDLGGHSLAAARIISRVMQVFPRELPVTALFNSPTVGEMSKIVARAEATAMDIDKILSELESTTDDEPPTESES